jgi:hypothetical protein
MKFAALFAAFAVSALIAAPVTPAAAATASFAGKWDTITDKNWTYTLDLEQDGKHVTGDYVAMDGGTGEIDGFVKGSVLKFNWTQGEFEGTGQFAMNADGDSFTGVYQADQNDKLPPEFLQGKWTGTRQKPGNFGGVWDTKTDKNWTYVITLIQKGKNVNGTYVAQDGGTGEIDGKVSGKVLQFDWEQGEFKGTGQFSLAANGKTFTGVYQAEPNAKLGPEYLQGTWSGTKR